MSLPSAIGEAWEGQNVLQAALLLASSDHGSAMRVIEALAAGTSYGEDVRQLAGRVQSVLNCEHSVAYHVTRNIVGAALSEAHFRDARATGLTHKIWLCPRGHDPLPCGHASVEQRYAETPCPIDKPFLVNEKELMFPRDYRSGHWEECVNCECAMIAKRPRV